MTDLYLRSTTGSDTNDALTWATSRATMMSLTASLDAAGDRVFFSQAHAESNGSADQWYSFANSQALPVTVLCVSDSAEPPTEVATGGSFTTTSARQMFFQGSFYWRGARFNCTSGTSVGNMIFGATTGNAAHEAQVFDLCGFNLPSTGNTLIRIGQDSMVAEKYVEWKNCTLKFGGSGQYIQISADFVWRGGAIEAGSATPSSGIFRGAVPNSTVRGANVLVDGVDLSALSSSAILVRADSYKSQFRFNRCRLPEGWSGSLVGTGGVNAVGCRVSMYNCDSASTNYRMWVEDYSGSIKSETTNVRSGGATDGTTAIAWRMSSSANANEFVAPLQSDEMAVWVDQVGVSKTVEIEVLTDGVALTNAEMWADVSYGGNAGSTLGSLASTRRSHPLVAASANPASAATWNTTGLSAPVKQKLSVTFTPQQKGPVFIRVCLAKPSTVVFVCPRPTVF